MTESEFLKSAEGAHLEAIKFCNYKTSDKTPSLQGYTSFLAFNLGCALFFDNDIQLFSTWTEDPYGDPYRIRIYNMAKINEDALLIVDATHTETWKKFVGKKLDEVEVNSYRSSYNRDGVDGIHDVDWGMKFYFDDYEMELLVAAISSENPYRKGTQEEILVSENREFIAQQEERFEDFLGFYGVLS